MGKEVLISVIIPVKNGAHWLHNTISTICKQTLFTKTEIIVIDSGSTDATLDILKKHPVQIVQIQPQEFNHGTTRNLGVALAKGRYVVMTVQDAQPTDERWLEQLLSEFHDEEVVAVCGKQIVPHVADANPVYWHRPFSKPQKRSVQYSAECFRNLTPYEKKQACALDDVNAMYKREKLLELPFRNILFGEDMNWAMDALQKGWKLIYTDFAAVYHHHTDQPSYVEKRTYTECFFRYKIFGYKYEPASLVISSIRDLKILYSAKGVTIKQKLFWLFYNFRVRLKENKAIRQFQKDLKNGELWLNNNFDNIFANKSPMASNSFYKQRNVKKVT